MVKNCIPSATVNAGVEEIYACDEEMKEACCGATLQIVG